MTPAVGSPGLSDSEPPGRSEYQIEYLRRNPETGGAVRNLLDLQSRYFALERQYQDEMSMLELEHHARCRSLFRDREAIVNSKAAEAEEAEAEEVPEGEGESGEGIPHFWLRAMRNHPKISRWINPRDEPALNYLRDVRVELRQEDNGDDEEGGGGGGGCGGGGFRILFDFDDNPFFSDRTLTKTFVYEREPEAANIYGELKYSKATGCVVHWHPGKDLTAMEVVAPGQPEWESFFDFFGSTSWEEAGGEGEDGADDVGQYEKSRDGEAGDDENDDGDDENDGGDDENDDGDDENDDGDDESDEDDESGSALDCDFELGEEIKNNFIPYAVHWYTREALLYEDECDFDEGEGREENNGGEMAINAVGRAAREGDDVDDPFSS